MPLEQEALARHMTHHVAVHALGLQRIMEFIHKLELPVTCGGCRLQVASLVFNGQLCGCRSRYVVVPGPALLSHGQLDTEK